MHKLPAASPATKTPSPIDWFKKMAGDSSTAGGRVFAREVKGEKILFIRSATADALMRRFSPARWSQQNQLAHQLIDHALSRAYPNLNLAHLKGLAGIGSAGGIRVKDVRFIENAAKKLVNINIRDDLDTALRQGAVKLKGLKLANSPGLDKFFDLKGVDLLTWFNHPQVGHKGGLMSFRELIGDATTMAGSNPVTQAADDKAVAKFLASWSHLSVADKDALRDRLGPDGKAAMAAVDALVPNLVNALALPIAGAHSFGIGKELSTDPATRNSLDQVSKTIPGLLAQPKSNVRQSMNALAADLGARLSDAMRNGSQAPEPVALLAQSHQLERTVRDFIDKHMNPSAACDHPNQSNAAIGFWLEQKDDFTQRVCAAVMQGLLSPAEKGAGNELRIGQQALHLGKALGQGAEGEVLLAQTGSPEGPSVALKITKPAQHMNFPLPASPREALLHQLASSTKNPHIVNFIHAGAARDGSIMLAMEYAPHGNLDDVIGALRKQGKAGNAGGSVFEMQTLSRHVLRSMASGLQALHELGIRHRDIKGGNFFIGDDGVVKIGDFGRSVLAAEDICLKRPNDTPQWLAPEFAEMPGAVQYTTGADIWAAGIVMLELATGQPSPFESTGFQADAFKKLDAFRNNPDNLDPAMRRKALGLDNLYRSDPNLANLLLDMLHPDPVQRPSAQAILERLPTTADNAAMGKLLIQLAKKTH